MATYVVTDPNTGRKVKLTGDSPPTEDELNQIFSNLLETTQAVNPETGVAMPEVKIPEGTMAGGVGEVAKAIGGGIIGSIEGGIQGINALEDGSVADANQALQSSQQEYARPPQTQTGQRYMENIGGFMGMADKVIATGIGAMPTALASLIEGTDMEADLKNLYSGGTEGLADRVFSETGNNVAAGTAMTLLPEVLGLIGGKAPITSEIKTIKSGILKSAIQAGKADPKIAEFMVNGAGKVVKDPAAKYAIKQGFDPGVIAAIKGSTKTDKKVMSQMVDVIKKMKEDAIYAQDARPSDPVGKRLIDRVNYVNRVRKIAGKEVDSASKALKNQPVDTQPVIRNFQRDLSEIGVKLDDAGNVQFKGSDIEGDIPAQTVIKRVINRMTDTKAPDAYDFHRMKKFIDNSVDYGKKNQKAMTGVSERVIKKLRVNLDSQLDSLSPAYDKANIKYSDTITALDQIGSAAGKKLDFNSPSAANQSGVLLRRLTSNIQSRGLLKDAIDATESVANKYGGKFEDNLSAQMLLAQELERVFKFKPSTSFGGEIKKNIDAAAGGQAGISSLAIDKIGGAVEKARGINEENAIKSLKSLLDEKK
tara:strand:+ start:5362 stop:7137 length:1776 start_codon:yes stop_codon:yes gene_type:complete